VFCRCRHFVVYVLAVQVFCRCRHFVVYVLAV